MSEQEKINTLFNSLLFARINKVLQDTQSNNDTPLAISNKIFDILKETKKEFDEAWRKFQKEDFGLLEYQLFQVYLKYFGE